MCEHGALWWTDVLSGVYSCLMAIFPSWNIPWIHHNPDQGKDNIFNCLKMNTSVPVTASKHCTKQKVESIHIWSIHLLNPYYQYKWASIHYLSLDRKQSRWKKGPYIFVYFFNFSLVTTPIKVTVLLSLGVFMAVPKLEVYKGCWDTSESGWMGWASSVRPIGNLLGRNSSCWAPSMIWRKR